MKICAVICELNPLHNGHNYIFKQARLLADCDAVLALMSGNFMQRAIPSVIDEYARAECALACGADAVIELPVVHAVAAAEKFARGAIDILNTIPCVDTLVMGVESRNVALIETLAQISAEESVQFKMRLREALDAGASFPRALTVAAAEEATKCGFDEAETVAALGKPNNILAIEYRKALIRTNSRIKFVPAPRIGGDISDDFQGRYSSASAIREHIESPMIAEAMPKQSYAVLRRELAAHKVNYDKFDALVVAALRLAAPEEIRDTPDCAEGMEHRIKKWIDRSSSYYEMLANADTSRFTRGRLARICVQNLLGIDKSMQNRSYSHARLLGLREKKKDILSNLPPNIITNKQSEQFMNQCDRQCYEAEQRACAIYSVITDKPNEFYKKLLFSEHRSKIFDERL